MMINITLKKEKLNHKQIVNYLHRVFFVIDSGSSKTEYNVLELNLRNLSNYSLGRFSLSDRNKEHVNIYPVE